MKKYIAEMLGTFTLVFCGCGAAIFSASAGGSLGIAFAFGLALMSMAYAIGPISGAHINPAVTFGVFCAGRMSAIHALGYIIFQFFGAIAASYALLLIAQGRMYGYNIDFDGLGQNGWGFGYASGYDMISAILFEFIATFIFVKVVLPVTKLDWRIGGVVIGLTLTLIHIVGLPITGVSVNPARSFGPALFVGGKALAQVWLFLLVPTIAGIFAGLTSRCCCCGCCSCHSADEEEEKIVVAKEVKEEPVAEKTLKKVAKKPAKKVVKSKTKATKKK